MIASFTGVQSSGKTTLLNYLKERNKDNFTFIPEVTRLIKREYDVSINEDGNDITQLLIMNQHLMNLHKREYVGKDMILDRCSIDGLLYTYWLWLQGHVDAGVYGYVSYLHTKLASSYDVIFYTDPRDVELVDDGERSVDKAFRDEMIDIFESHIKSNTSSNIVTISGTVEERLQQIKQHIPNINI